MKHDTPYTKHPENIFVTVYKPLKSTYSKSSYEFEKKKSKSLDDA